MDQHSHDAPVHDLRVDLPGGGHLQLQTVDEVDLWEESSKRYIEDYGLEQQNDLLLLGAVLSQQLAMYRAQQRMNGLEPEFDASGVPTGRYKKANVKASDMTAAQNIIIKAGGEIRELEKTLGIDKKSREAGGQQTVASYVGSLKEAARRYGLHLANRQKAYEEFCMEMRWKLRLLRNGDAEDRAYHDLSPDKLLKWAEDQLKHLEEVDQKYAREIGKIYVGRVR
jgi:hypothetical protein